LSGRLPYESETPTGQIIKHITDPIPNLLAVCEGLPPAVQRVLERAMAKRREDRYAKASDMALALQAVIAGRPLPGPAARPAPATPPAKPSVTTNRPTQPTPIPRPAGRGLPGWLPYAVIGVGCCSLC
jgi:serine/threonine-protein kinase